MSMTKYEPRHAVDHLEPYVADGDWQHVVDDEWHKLTAEAHITHHLGQGLAAFLFLTLVLLILWSVLAVFLAGNALADHPVDAPRNASRLVDFEPPILNAIVRCESGGKADVHNAQNGIASGAFQDLPSTWNYIARLEGRTRLIGLNPSQATLAQQIRINTALYERNGTSPWLASRHCWATASQAPVRVFGDRQTKARKKCRRSMRNSYGYSRPQARRICRAPDTQNRSSNPS